MAKERERLDVQQKQKKFKDNQRLLDVHKLVFVDEAGFRLGGTPRYGWAPRGVDANGSHVQGNWQSMTMLGAIALDGFRGFATVNAGTGNEVFQAFVEQELVPRLRPDDIVIMDNLAAHKNARIIKKIEHVGATVIFTPPYSPEFNPIEKTWAKLKDAIRRMNTETREAFDNAVAKAMESISQNDIRGWVAHAGYAIN